MRVSFFMEGFGPYRVPFWNRLAGHVELTVLLLSKVEKGRHWKVDLENVKCPVKILDSMRLFIRGLDWAFYWTYSDVFKALKDARPNLIIIGGWSSPGYWAARRWAIRNNIPLVFWSESHSLSTRTLGIWPFNIVKTRFLKPFAGGYAFSTLSSTYLQSLGMSADKIVESYNLPDILAFQKCERIGESQVPVLLYVGQLIDRKGVIRLLEELALVKDQPWRLDIVGDGYLRESLINKTRDLSLSERIRFLGFIQPEKLSDVYRTADILFMPSFNEVWGLVLHEALLSGVFVIGSDRAAASHALIQEGVNGYMCSPFQSGVLARVIRNALEQVPFDRVAIRETIAEITIEREVDKLVNLLVKVATPMSESSIGL